MKPGGGTSGGEDIVVGAIQGRQSEELQCLLSKLELVPPLQTPEGQVIDLEAILRRSPQVCVIARWRRRIRWEAAIRIAGKMCKIFYATESRF
jgi:hypothetical protein